MIVRIVYLPIKPDGLETFGQLYSNVVQQIRNCPGCEFVQLVTDTLGQGDCYAISHWHSEAELEDYRHSPFFRSLWPQVKKLMRDQSWAQSCVVLFDEPEQAE